jgi:hypothetical protein
MIAPAMVGSLMTVLSLSLTPSAFAGSVDVGSNCGQTSVNGFSLSYAGGSATTKTIDGTTGCGIGGGSVGGEIDGVESITVGTPGGQTVHSAQIAFLYPQGEFGDTPDEVARFILDFDNALSRVATFTATGADTGTTSHADITFRNLGLAQDGAGEDGVRRAGLWEIIFGGAFSGASTITFESGNTGSSARSDFAVGSVTAVPLPAAAWMFGSALLGLVAFNRRRRTA